MNNRCLITESQNTLGKSLSAVLGESCEIIGYDPELGDDLSQQDQRDRLIERLKDCQIFVNNSHISQIELLNRAVELQNDLVIINISSGTGYYEMPEELMIFPEFQEYLFYKQRLNDRVREIHNAQARGELGKCWVINIRSNYLSSHWFKDSEDSMIDTGDISHYINHILGCWPKMAVQDVLLYRSSTIDS